MDTSARQSREPDVVKEDTDWKEILRNFVPKTLYDDLRSKYDEILLKIGRMQEQMLFLLEDQLGEEKEEGGEETPDLREKILDHIRQTIDIEAQKDVPRNRSATVRKLLEELKEKCDETDRLRQTIERLKARE